MSDKIERAKAHLATCMERDDFPYHNCACNCDDVAQLLAENERLKAQKPGCLYHCECDRLTTENERLRAALDWIWNQSGDLASAQWAARNTLVGPKEKL